MESLRTFAMQHMIPLEIGCKHLNVPSSILVLSLGNYVYDIQHIVELTVDCLVGNFQL